MATEIIFRGHQQPSGLKVYADHGGARWVVDPRLDLRRHSSTGFQCGYSGSGPAQLALAILAYQFDEDTALFEYQAFKTRVISKIDQNWRTWSLRLVNGQWVIDAPGREHSAVKAGPPKNVWDWLIEE